MREIGFHPLVTDWFTHTFTAPTQVQEVGWGQISTGADTLIAAPTGSGKTLTAFLWALNELVEAGVSGTLEERTYLVYVSPLKALGSDIHKNLQVPLAGIQQLAEARGIELPHIRVAVRSGDTPMSERQRMIKRPPHILITTPESLYILLTAAKSREALKRGRTVIVDEIHAVAGDKRGAHLALSLERLDMLAGRHLQRIGLSATQKPIEEIAHLLVGSDRLRADGSPDCSVVDVGHRREIDLSVQTPEIELGPITSQDMRAEIYDRLVELVGTHRTTIIFVNTRRLVERVAHALGERLGKEKVAAHHGSLSRETRLAAEDGLKSGTVPVVVATASLELGIDVGHVDLVCHLGAPRSLATLLQRVGRSGHFLGAIPKGIIFPLTRDELVQCAAAVRAVYAGELDRVHVFENPLDILAQQMVATVASDEISVENLWAMIRRAYPFRNLARKDFDDVLEMLAEGVSTRRGRRSAHLHYDRVHGTLRARRGARLASITSGGAIPDTADYDVVEDPGGVFVGKVNEDFAIESMAGDIFLLGNRSWRIQRVEAGRMRVADAQGAPPSIPFWMGEAPARTLELSAAVGDLRREVAERRHDPMAVIDWLIQEVHVDPFGAEQLVRYIDETLAVLGAVPTLDTVIAERFFDEAGGMQLVLHTPFGGRVNRAFGLALRKRFCVTFDFELQAAATDDGIVLSLGEQHSFPLDSVFAMVRRQQLREDLTQAALVSPMFTNRWRWNITRALVLLRHNGGKKVPMPIQRMRAEDLMAAVFPAQLACGDNHRGPIEPVDHPLVNETINNCLFEAMDTDGLARILADIDAGRIRTIAVETPAPSPMSHEILNANPYAFLDDAPLEERRARAVNLRRTDPDLATGIGALDPKAIAEVRAQAWPEARNADEVHDALLTLGVLPEGDAEPWSQHLEALMAVRRVTRLAPSVSPPPGGGDEREQSPAPGGGEYKRGPLYVAAERLALAKLVFPDATCTPALTDLPDAARFGTALDAESAVVEIVRGWMDCLGPTTASALAERLSLAPARVESALARLEADGVVLRGHFTARDAASELEWCERALLSRIHRLTLGRLRKEIEAVSAADYIRFLFRWQNVQPGTQLHGRDGIRRVIGQLQGLELPGPAWERDVLPARIAQYLTSDLEQLCLAGEIAWGRLKVTVGDEEPSPDLPRPTGENQRGGRTPRRRQAPTRSAPLAFFLRESMDELLEPRQQRGAGRVVLGHFPEVHEAHDVSGQPVAEGRKWVNELSPIAVQVLEHLEKRGASFMADIARAVRHLPTEVEDALWELVASGLVTGDGIAGLRTLLVPDKDRQSRHPKRGTHLRSIPGRGSRRMMPVGRWSLLRTEAESERDMNETAELAAQRLLRRYGVVVRELCARERRAPSWRYLLPALRRMEARGQVRGGRFVSGFVGEQFALPEAVETLRSVRRKHDGDEIVIVAAADPLNVVGILTPGAKVSPFSGQVIAYRNGIPIEIGELGAVRSKLQVHVSPRAPGIA